MIARGIEKVDREAIKLIEPSTRKEDNVVVKEELKGLWVIDGLHCVVEGECPVCQLFPRLEHALMKVKVCRKPIPGGFGPPKSGIGGVIPLEIRIGGLNGSRKRR